MGWGGGWTQDLSDTTAPGSTGPCIKRCSICLKAVNSLLSLQGGVEPEDKKGQVHRVENCKEITGPRAGPPSQPCYLWGAQ
jgi:hypothetical protein